MMGILSGEPTPSEAFALDHLEKRESSEGGLRRDRQSIWGDQSQFSRL